MSAEYALNSVFDRLRPLRRSKVRFVLTLGFLAVALALTATVQAVWGSSLFLIFATAIVASTALYGFLAGIGAAILAAITVDFFYIPPIFALNMDSSTFRVAVQFAVLALVTHIATRKISASIRSRAKVGITGQLDEVVDGEAYGWAINVDDPLSPVNVVVYVNDRPVAEVGAVYYRPDVASFTGSSGKHGFYVDLRDYCPADTQAVVDVRLTNPTRLANCPMQAIIPANTARSSPTILFMHIPKTAGTAFREAMVANYKEAEIAYLYPDPPGFLVKDLRLLPLYQRSRFRLVIGHFQYGIQDWLPQASTYATVVRHPFARAVSHYLYLFQTQPWVVIDEGHSLSLEAVLEQRRTADLDNTMVRYFSGVDEKDVPAGMIHQEIYERAVHYLRTAFTFVGHQECANRSYAMLESLFHWGTKRDLGMANLNPKSLSLMEQENLRKTVEHYNRWDYLLYDEILRLFPRD